MGSAPPTSKLFEPVQVGDIKLSTRIALAPLTRFRAEDDHVILPLAQTYYEQRGCVPGTLLISEATLISKQAGGYQNVPGIYTQEQIDAWKAVTKSVHAKGSSIYLQLWALGRVADPKVKQAEDSGDVVSSSPVPYQEGASVPRALSEDEIQQYIKVSSLVSIVYNSRINKSTFRTMPQLPRTRLRLASMVWRSTRPTATSSTNSPKIRVTRELISGEAQWRIAPALPSK